MQSTKLSRKLQKYYENYENYESTKAENYREQRYM